MTTEEQGFWERAARDGLPRFRFFRRSLSVDHVDKELRGTLTGEYWSKWLELRERIEAGDQIWPFEFHTRPFLGLRSGYVVLRKGRPIGGVVTWIS